MEILGESGVEGGRQYTEDIGQSGDHLRDLADTGLDFTAIGSTIVLMPEDWSASVGTLTDVDFPEGLVVAEDGTSLATRCIVQRAERASATRGPSGMMTRLIVFFAGPPASVPRSSPP